PGRDLVRERGLALDALRDRAALARVEHAEHVLAGDDRIAALGRVGMVGLAHRSRQVLSFINPRRIQLFMVPSGTSMRWASCSYVTPSRKAARITPAWRSSSSPRQVLSRSCCSAATTRSSAAGA